MLPALGFTQVYEDLFKAEQGSFYAKQKVKSKRSGGEYDLIYQKLSLTVNPSTRNIFGNVYSELIALENGFTQFAYDLDDRMSVDSVLVNGARTIYSHSNDEVIIFPQGILKDDRLSTTVYYKGDPSVNEQKGFSYDFQKDGPIAWTLSEPYGAYGWWPCKQQLTDKIDSVDMQITIPPGNKAACLGLLKSVDTLNNDWLVYNWEHRYTTTTYLVALAVTNYYEESHYIHFKNGDSLFHTDYLYPAYKPAADTLRRNIDGMMLLFDSLFGEYPFMQEKYGHAQFGRGGGMEHQTMSFMSDLNFDLMAHELAHQWFGNKITCGSWQDLWLNEGFATYLNAIAREHLVSKNRFLDFVNFARTRVIESPGGSVYAYDTSSANILFDGRLRYRKGALVLHMLRWNLGDEVFYKALKNYMQDDELAFGFARTENLQTHLEEESGLDLTEFFDKWIYKEGFPAVSFRWSRRGEELELDISQLTSHNSVDFFPLKLEVYLKGENKDSMLIIDLNTKEQILQFTPGFKVTELILDPNSWLLMQATVIEGDHLNTSSVVVYPNPTNGRTSLYVKEKKMDEVEVLNMLGQVVISKKVLALKNTAVELDLTSLSDGTYVIRTTSGDEVVLQKIVKAPTR